MVRLRRCVKFLVFLVVMLCVSINLTGCLPLLAALPAILSAIQTIGAVVGTVGTVVGLVGSLVGGKSGETMQQIGGIASAVGGGLGSIADSGSMMVSAFSSGASTAAMTVPSSGQSTAASPQSQNIDAGAKRGAAMTAPPPKPTQKLGVKSGGGK